MEISPEQRYRLLKQICFHLYFYIDWCSRGKLSENNFIKYFFKPIPCGKFYKLIYWRNIFLRYKSSWYKKNVESARKVKEFSKFNCAIKWEKNLESKDSGTNAISATTTFTYPSEKNNYTTSQSFMRIK